MSNFTGYKTSQTLNWSLIENKEGFIAALSEQSLSTNHLVDVNCWIFERKGVCKSIA